MIFLLVCNLGSTFATDNNDFSEENAGMYRNILCPRPNCNGELITTYTYGNWQNTGTSRDCEHYQFGLDYLFKRSVTVSRDCNVCTYGYTSQLSPETKWECYGGN